MKARRNFIALLILIVIILMIIAPVAGSLAEEGFFKGMWLNVIEEIPFGSTWGELAIHIFTKFISAELDTEEYFNYLQQIQTGKSILQEFCKLCLTAIVYDAVDRFGELAMGLRKKSGGWMLAQKVLWKMFCAFICAVIAGLVLQIAFGQINQLGSIAANIWTGIVTLVVMIGAVGIHAFLLELGIVMTLIYTMLKLIFVNVITIILSYIFLLLMILFASEQVYVSFLEETSIWAIWILMLVLLAGIDLMIQSVFGID